MKPAGWARIALLFAAVISGITVSNSSRVSAADGSGANIVSPTEVTQSSTGNVLTFTFTAAEVMDSGGIRISVPSGGWSTPQGVAGTAGYTTASSSGTIGTVKNNLDTATGWVFSRHMTLSADTGDKQEGSASLSNAITASAAANEQWYFNYGVASNWGTTALGNLRVGMWLKSSVATASGDFSWQNDDSANLGSPLDTITIPALTANTWEYKSVTLGATARNSISSYGLRYTNDIGAATLKVDAISTIFHANDSNTGWTGDSNITDSALTTSGDFIEGTGAVRCTYAGSAGIGVSGDCYDNEGSVITVGPGTTVSFWVRSSIDLSAGDFAWVDDDSSGLASVDSSVNLPALTANSWTYITLNSLTSDSLRSFGLRQLVDKGAMTIDIDAIGKVVDSGDSPTGWTVPADVQALSADASVFQEGTASLKNVITASAVSGEKWYETLGVAENWSGYTTAGFWIRSTVATLAGDLKFEYASSSDLTSPIASIDIGALSANTWTFQKLTLTGTRTSVQSYGVNYLTDIGAATVYLDDVLLGPGIPTFSGNDINVRVLSLPSSGTVSVLYGDGGGSSGATASSSFGTSTFTTQSRSSDAGTLTGIASSPSVEVVSASATKFVIDNPTDGTVDAPITVTVRALRSNNSLATNYQSDVTLVASGSVTGEGLVDIVNGVGTLNISDTVAETVNLSLSDTQTTGLDVSSTQDVVFGVGALAKFTLNDPGDITAGNRAAYTVSRRDQHNNLISSGTTTAYLYSTSTGGNKAFYDAPSGGNIITSVTISPGSSSANFWYYDDKSGTWTITASDNVTAPDGLAGVDDATDSITVNAAAAASFVLNDPGNIAAGTRAAYVVTRFDVFNNPTTSGSNTVYLYSNSSGPYAFYDAASAGNVITSVIISGGSSSANFWYYDEAAGTWTVTASDNVTAPDGLAGVDDATDSITVSVTATRFTILEPTDTTVDSSATITVRAENNSGALDTAYQSDVTLVASGSATGEGLVNIVNGVGTLQISDTVAETVIFTLSDTQATGLNVSSTKDIIFSPGATTSFSLNNPGDITAGVRAAYTVTKKDQFGNTTPSGSVTVYFYSTSTGTHTFYDAASAGNVITSIIISSGSSSANFWYYDEKAGTWTITASDNISAPDGTVGIDDATDSITVSAAAVSQFTLNNPGDITAGTRAAYTVTRADAFGNPITAGPQTVYLYSSSTGGNKAFYDAASAGNVITSVIIPGGSSSANFWYYDDLAGTWTITASDNVSAPDGTVGIDDATDSITVSAAAVSQFVLNDPGDINAGTRAAYTVTRKDVFGNLVTSGSNTVFLYSSSTSGNKAFYDAASAGNVITSVIISGGSSSANFWYYDDLAGTWTITASDNATSPDGTTGVDDATDPITVTQQAATKFIIINPTDGTVDNPVTVTVRAENDSGVVDASYQSDVTLVASGSATGEGLVNIVNGVGTLQISDTVAETVVFTLSDTQTTGLNVSSTQDVVFAPGATASFALNDPGDITAGTRGAYTVMKKDQFGNTTPSGSVIAYLYSSSSGSNKAFYDAAVSGAQITSVTIGSGSSSANFWYYDELVGTWTITASDNVSAPDGVTGIDDATDSITVSAAAVSKLELNNPADIVAGTRAAYTVSRKDAFNNLVTSGSQTVYLYSSSTGPKSFYDAPSAGTVITSVIILDASSSVNFWYYDERAGNWSVTASDNVTAPDGVAGIDDAADTITVSAAATGKFLLNNPGDMTASTRLGYVVSREDSFGNVVSSGTDTIYLYSSSGGPYAFYNAAANGNQITFITISGGSSSANFWYYDEAAGTWTVTASDNVTAPDGVTGIDDATDSVSVSSAPIVATRFTIVEPVDATVGASVSVTVRAEDNSGSVDTSYQSDVTLVASGSATGDGLVDIVNGVGTLQISDSVAETVALTLSDTQSTGLNVTSAKDVIFSVGPTAALFLNDPGGVTAGTRAAYVVTRKDQFGNLVTSGAETFYLYSTSTGTRAFYDAAVGGTEITSVVFLNGSSSVSFWYADEKVGNWVVTVSDNATSPDGVTGIDDAEDIIQITPGSVSRFSLNNPGDMTSGTRLGYTVSREDAFGNLVTSDSTTVYLYSDSSGPKFFYDSAIGGSVITSITIGNGSYSANFWYYDEPAGTKTVIASDNASAPDGLSGVDDATDSVVVTSGAIVATRFTIVEPADARVGEVVTVTVRAEDNSGSVDTTYQSDVTLVVSGSATGGGLVDIINGVGTRQISSSASETVILTLSDTQSTGLNVSSLKDMIFSVLPSLRLAVPSAPPALTTARFSGRTFPGAKIIVTALGNGASARQERAALPDGSFDISIAGFAPGNRSFALVAYDADGVASQRRVFNLTIPAGETASVSDISFPPTIRLARVSVTKGDNLLVTGYAIPGGTIEPLIDGEFFREAYAAVDPTGIYRLIIGTISLDFGNHSLSVRETGIGVVIPLVSPTKTFSVSKLFTPKTDLNRDDKIDISDWSIFISKWTATGDPSRAENLDFNGDGKVDIADFSIFVRTIKR